MWLWEAAINKPDGMWERSIGCKALFDPQNDARKASYRRFHGHAGSAFSRNRRSASGDRLSNGLDVVGCASLGRRHLSRLNDRRASAESFGRPSAIICYRNSCKVFSGSSGMADPAVGRARNRYQRRRTRKVPCRSIVAEPVPIPAWTPHNRMLRRCERALQRWHGSPPANPSIGQTTAALR
jgi:hypothetical protein